MNTGYTKEEREIAQAIVGNKDYCALLAKVLLTTEDKLTTEVVSSKTNEQLGEIVRADTLADNKIQLRWNKLKQLGQSVSKEVRKIPK